MMVTFISECEKKVLSLTCRVLDAFANRIGSRTWQTATKNTAVSCHWIRSRSRSKLLWVVGNREKINAQEIVPVNLTDTEIEKYNAIG